MDRNVQLQNLRDLAEVWISILVVNIPRNQRSKDVSPSWSESAEPRRGKNWWKYTIYGQTVPSFSSANNEIFCMVVL
ncbi:hypothetical protein Y032_0145g2474 [Ancylostoma ceylanicum]|uniref:Uncharacterized protein n=1 Tax=Ancylostoma ceylanicum TaxID=53326 RepID=A0A016T1L3_9BILA|nr:hypothetical protein Y032_0145g2474 [Ancylostoma ceylanicum]